MAHPAQTQVLTSAVRWHLTPAAGDPHSAGVPSPALCPRPAHWERTVGCHRLLTSWSSTGKRLGSCALLRLLLHVAVWAGKITQMCTHLYYIYD